MQSKVMSFLSFLYASPVSQTEFDPIQVKELHWYVAQLVFFSLHFFGPLQSFPSPRVNYLFRSSYSGGNMQLPAIKTRHSLEKANITKPMMF